MVGNDNRIGMADDGHEGDGSENQGPSSVPVEPVHVSLTPTLSISK
jgi:hypothetical protein